MLSILHITSSNDCKSSSLNPKSFAFRIISSLAKSTSIMVFSLVTDHHVNKKLNAAQEGL